MAIDRVELIVHPLYHFTGENPGGSPESMPEGRFLADFLMRAHRKAVLEAKSNPKTLLVIVDNATHFNDRYSRMYSRFVDFAQKSLGERFLLLGFAFGIRASPGHQLSKMVKSEIAASTADLRKFDFASRVKIVAGGEYADNCVATAAKNIDTILSNEFGKKAIVTFRPDAMKRMEFEQALHNIHALRRQKPVTKKSVTAHKK